MYTILYYNDLRFWHTLGTRLPEPKPTASMDRAIPVTEQRAARRGRLLRWGLVALLVGVGGYFGLRALRPAAEAGALRFATVDRGAVRSTINAAGLVVPAFEEQLNAPVATEIRRVLLRPGAEVAVGDLVMELDREYVALQLEGRRDQLTLAQNNIDLEQLAFDRDLRDLELDTEVAALELSSAEAELADARRLLQVGGATAEDVERAELAVEMAGLARDKLANQLAYTRASDAGKRRRLQLEVAMEEKEVAQLSRRLRETKVTAPRAGVVTWINESIGQLVPEGEPLVRIADLGAFRVEGSVSDRYTGQVTPGMPVEVRYAGKVTRGAVASVLPEVTNNTLRFLVALDDEAAEGLRPNMRVDVRVVTGEVTDVLRLRNGAAIRGGAQQRLFVVRGDEAVRTEVTVGQRGGEYVEVVAGLRERDRVVIAGADDYDGPDVIRLETAGR